LIYLFIFFQFNPRFKITHNHCCFVHVITTLAYLYRDSLDFIFKYIYPTKSAFISGFFKIVFALKQKIEFFNYFCIILKSNLKMTTFSPPCLSPPSPPLPPSQKNNTKTTNSNFFHHLLSFFNIFFLILNLINSLPFSSPFF